MANSLCIFSLCSFTSSNKQGLVTGNSVAREVIAVINVIPNGGKRVQLQSLKVKATGSDQGAKSRSIVCDNCDGNGAVVCPQCKGGAVNLVDHFDGRFKAGGLCWLCRGKKDILCGSCNGAGFIGGFMSTCDD